MPDFASVKQTRRHFPALARTHNGHPVAYFDGPGGTQVPRRVVAAMTEYLLQHNANTDWAFPTSQETDQALFEARGALADWVGGRSEEHTSELQSRLHLVCRLLLEKKKATPLGITRFVVRF